MDSVPQWGRWLVTERLGAGTPDGKDGAIPRLSTFNIEPISLAGREPQYSGECESVPGSRGLNPGGRFRGRKVDLSAEESEHCIEKLENKNAMGIRNIGFQTNIVCVNNS